MYEIRWHKLVHLGRCNFQLERTEIDEPHFADEVDQTTLPVIASSVYRYLQNV